MEFSVWWCSSDSSLLDCEPRWSHSHTSSSFSVTTSLQKVTRHCPGSIDKPSEFLTKFICVLVPKVPPSYLFLTQWKRHSGRAGNEANIHVCPNSYQITHTHARTHACTHTHTHSYGRDQSCLLKHGTEPNMTL